MLIRFARCSQKCPKCGGTGVVMTTRQLGPGFVQQMQSECVRRRALARRVAPADGQRGSRCTQCHGQGKIIKTKCTKCAGSKLEVRIVVVVVIVVIVVIVIVIIVVVDRS
jgi:DnaJ-class molecular chaperone